MSGDQNSMQPLGSETADAATSGVQHSADGTQGAATS
jgi:hypothetical protein